jgi:hypothetical protein
MWHKVTETEPSFEDMEVIGYNEKWIDEDFNLNGTRACFRCDAGENGFISARWCDYQDSYVTDYESVPTHFTYIQKKPEEKDL